jgi:hypothetical protein
MSRTKDKENRQRWRALKENRRHAPEYLSERTGSIRKSHPRFAPLRPCIIPSPGEAKMGATHPAARRQFQIIAASHWKAFGPAWSLRALPGVSAHQVVSRSNIRDDCTALSLNSLNRGSNFFVSPSASLARDAALWKQDIWRCSAAFERCCWQRTNLGSCFVRQKNI